MLPLMRAYMLQVPRYPMLCIGTAYDQPAPCFKVLLRLTWGSWNSPSADVLNYCVLSPCRESSVKTVVAWISELEELRKQFQKVQLSPTDVLPDDPGSSSSGSHAPAGAKAVLGQSCSCQDAQCSSGAAANVTNKQGEEPLKNTEAAGEQAVGECALARAQLR